MSDNVEYLNLDDVEPSVKKVLTIKGVQYDFKQPSVGEFISEMKRLRALQKKFSGKGKDVDEYDIVEAMLTSQQNSVRQAFPGIPEDVLSDLNTDQLTAVRNFIQAQIKEDNAEAADEAGNAPATVVKSKQ